MKKRNIFFILLLSGIVFSAILSAGCTVVVDDSVEHIVDSETDTGGNTGGISISSDSMSFTNKVGDHISFESMKTTDVANVMVKINSKEYNMTVSDEDNETFCGDWKSSDGTSIHFLKNGSGNIHYSDNSTMIFWGKNSDGSLVIIQGGDSKIMKYTYSEDTLKDTSGKIFKKE